LSILIVYLFFTPGILLWPDVLWGPTQQGLTQGLMRIAVLVLIVAAVNVLISSTGQEEFLSAISWCLQPLSWLGLSHERLAVRISLTLATVGVLRTAYRQVPREAVATNATTSEPRLRHIANTAHRLFAEVVNDAEQATLQTIALPEQTQPPLLQWIIPVLLLALLLAVSVVTTDVG
jgi:energy-coupling factor transport system permease protein